VRSTAVDRCGTAAAPLPCYTNFSQAFGPIGFEFDTSDVSFFAADDWRIFPRLSLSLGIRYEREVLPEPFSNLINPLLPGSAKMPLDKIYDRIEEDLRNQYNLGYTPDPAANEGSYHKITLKTKQKDLTVQARDGYYANR
jgi:outer membrane receptor protein involved in Fe transport